MNIIKLLITLIMTLATVQGAQAAPEQEKPVPMSLILQWTPQSQFAGYFIAQEKGFYEKHGIKLTIISGGPDKVVSDYLDSNRATLGTMFLATAMERRDAGVPLVNIGQIIQHSTLMLIAKAGKGIKTLKDLDQHKVSLWANEFQIQPRLLFKQLDIDVEIIPLASSMDLFLRDAVSATSAMWYNEYHTILSAGLRESEIKPFFFRDTAFDFPEDGLYCLEETLAQNPVIAHGLVQATLEGWRYAFDHEDEALKTVFKRMNQANLPINKMHQRWMLNRMRDILLIDNSIANHGILERQVFQRVNEQLLQANVIRNPLNYDDFYAGPQHDK